MKKVKINFVINKTAITMQAKHDGHLCYLIIISFHGVCLFIDKANRGSILYAHTYSDPTRGPGSLLPCPMADFLYPLTPGDFPNQNHSSKPMSRAGRDCSREVESCAALGDIWRENNWQASARARPMLVHTRWFPCVFVLVPQQA